MTPEEAAVTDRLAHGEPVPGGPGACARCHHAEVWHTPKTTNRPCEIGHRAVTAHLDACGCRAYQLAAALGGAA